jgi:hypothetical protein
MGGNVRHAHKGGDRVSYDTADTPDEDPRDDTADDRYGQRGAELYCPYCGDRCCGRADNYCVNCGAELTNTFQ